MGIATCASDATFNQNFRGDEMNDKKSPTHLIFTTVHFCLAIVTLIPLASASKASLLGYKALCSFTPISTIVLILLAGMHILLHIGSLAKAKSSQDHLP
jgi:hypothetical protein